MSQDALRKQLKTGVDNVEVDWFLRGKLPDFASSEAHPYSHHNSHESASPSIKSPSTTLTESATTSPPTTATSLSTAISRNTLNSPHDLDVIPEGSRSGNSSHKSFDKPLTRSKSISYKELEQIKKEEPPKKKGFFRSLFKSKDKDPTPSPSPTPEIEKMPLHEAGTESILTNLPQISSKASELRRTRSLSGCQLDLDPKLAEFLRYYKSKGVSQLQNDMKPSNRNRGSTSTVASSTVTIAETLQSPEQTTKKPIVDALGRPIPAHPATPKFPSAMSKNPRYNTVVDKPAQFLEQHSKLSFLKKVKSTQSDIQSLNSITSRESTKPPVSVPGLEDLPPLKRVAFDIPVFFNDPPQQIPSRNPRKGEVEVRKDGSIVIHKLSSAERRRLLTKTDSGIVVGGTGHLKIIVKDSEETDCEQTIPETTEGDVRENQSKQEEEAPAPKNNEDDVSVSSDATKISIDKPMVRHTKSTVSLLSLAEDEEQDEVFPPRDTKVPLDVLYTRCCHLREILPIAATLKQIKKDSYDPITLLQLRNPKPSLVEVLTFSDFISVAPILCISLDGVSLSADMLRIILAALANKPELEKLTLRNTPIDSIGWKLLCWFLTKNQTLSRLDLTQVPSLTTNVQKPAKVSSTGAQVSRMECDLTCRSEMNWSLFNASLITRNGIEELVLNGSMMGDEEFKDLFELGISLRTTKLGLAYNRLTAKQCEVLGTCLDFDKIVGLDLGYNDLRGKLSLLNKFTQERKRQGTPQLRFVSLNSTSLDNENGEVSEFFSNLVGFKELRYIDISNNPKLFPEIIKALSENLPLYPNLSRMHLDYNDLSTTSIIAVAELIPFCKKLSYFSLMGNDLDNVSGSALASSLKVSSSVITLDVNYDQLSMKFREDMAMYTVRNMKNQIEKSGKANGQHEDFTSLQEQLSALLQSADAERGEMPDKTLVDGFLEKITTVRAKIHESIDELFKLRVQGGLNLEGKEALIRFCFIDSSIEKGLELLNKKLNLTPEQVHMLDNSSSDQQQEDEAIHRKLQAPNMTRQSSLSLSNYVDSQGHTELFPFGVIDNKHEHHHDGEDEEELKDDCMTRAADDYHIKEEASMLRIGSFIKSNETQLRDRIPSEHIEALLSISGDKLKDALLKTNNIQDLVGILDSFKEKGIALGEIYKKDQGEFNARLNNDGGLDLETLKNTQTNSLGKNSQSCELDGSYSDPRRRKVCVGTKETESDSDSESSSTNTKSGEEEGNGEVDLAYDEVLDHLERVRTNS